MEIVHPTSIQDLISSLNGGDVEGKIVAGGTALVLMMQQGLIAPERISSLKNIEGLNGIEERDGQISIGAMTTLRDIAADSHVRRSAPALAHSCSIVGNVRIRNVATLGGNLAEADYASDPPAVLVALDASVEIMGPDGSRTSPVEDLLTGFYSTTLEPAEVITAINIPAADSNSHQVYLKYRSRSSEDRPCVGVAAWAQLAGDGATIERLRVAVGAAAATPQRYPDVEKLAHGIALADVPADQIADGYSDQINALDDFRGSAWYRRQMTREFVRRALKALRDGERVA